MSMVDIGGKAVTERSAVAEGIVSVKPNVVNLIRQKKLPKGDVLEAARIAAILAAKKTHELIPLCHPIPIDFAAIEFSLKNRTIAIRTTIKGQARTGFEMEALTACAVAALTIYDMCKPIDKDIVISGIRLLEKRGGKSGTYKRA